MESGNKKILIILTNEAFIPKSGRGGRHPNPQPSHDGHRPHNPSAPHPPRSSPPSQENNAYNYSPSAWTSPQTTVLDPPALIKNSNPEEFLKKHRQTGIDLYEVGYFWLKFTKEYRAEIIFASPRGGPVPIEPTSIEQMEKDDKLKNQLKEEKELMIKLGHTYPISWVSNPEEYSMVLIPGGHGSMFDLPEHEEIGRIISRIYENGGYVGAIGHGVSALLNARCSRNRDEYLVKGKKVTCFTQNEEKEKRFEEWIPFNLEEKLRERGAKVETGKPFQPYVVVDERLITGQSWPSICEFIKKLHEECDKRHQQK